MDCFVANIAACFFFAAVYYREVVWMQEHSRTVEALLFQILQKR